MKHTFESEQQVTDMLNHFEGIVIEWFNGTLFIDFDQEAEKSERSARMVWHLSLIHI